MLDEFGVGGRTLGSNGGIGRFESGAGSVCMGRGADTTQCLSLGSTLRRVRGGVKTHAHFYPICTGMQGFVGLA